MDQSSKPQSRSNAGSPKSELEKFKLFYEYDTTTKEISKQIRQSQSS